MSEKKRQNHAQACDAENPNEIDAGSVTDNGTTSKDSSEKDPNVNSEEKECCSSEQNDSESGQTNVNALQEELEAVRNELAEKTSKCSEYFDKLQRTAAEFDNFKKRSIKEKEALYTDAVCDVVSAFLPVIDNVERALKAISDDSSAQTLKEGVEMIFKQFGDVLKKIGVEEIKALNETFDPMRHNAVMHVEDEAYGHSVVIEEFQKGYIYKDKVIRYSMVKVAN